MFCRFHLFGFRFAARFTGVALLTLFFSACSLLPGEIDNTASWSANRLYSEARSAMGDGNWEQAIQYFLKLESRYPYGRFAQQAQMETAYAHWKNDDSEAALAACDRFIRLHPNHPGVDYMLYLKGLIHFNGDLGYTGYLSSQDQSERDPKSAADSFEAFKELVSRFPESKYAPDATLRMKYLVDALASHETHVARYYYNRGAYIAAANRAQYALQHYPETPAQKDAMIILVRAYGKMGLEELRADAERVLRLNYPDSLEEAQREDPKKSWWQQLF